MTSAENRRFEACKFENFMGEDTIRPLTSFPCSHELGERTGQVSWQDNSRRVRTHETNSGETVLRLGTIIQSNFCAQSGAGIRLNFWK